MSDDLRRARGAGVTWEHARDLSDCELEQQLVGAPGRNVPRNRLPIDLDSVHRELRKNAATLQLRWAEPATPANDDPRKRRPYQCRRFCERYRPPEAWVNP